MQLAAVGCYNGCNGHGQCFDLEMAARIQDDVRLFTTTSYSLWDKNLVAGCVCDVGYTGYDCSLRFVVWPWVLWAGLSARSSRVSLQ